MIGLTIEEAKGQFFNPQAVLDAVNRSTLRAFAKFGAFVRQRAKSSNSLRYRKGVSLPGQPPASHTGLIRDFLFFVVERFPANVIIGPAKINGARSPNELEVLEHGGATTIMRHGKPQTIMLAARPFMQPAFDAELDKAVFLWQDSLAA